MMHLFGGSKISHPVAQPQGKCFPGSWEPGLHGISQLIFHQVIELLRCWWRNAARVFTGFPITGFGRFKNLHYIEKRKT
jgi:hypothetical protein